MKDCKNHIDLLHPEVLPTSDLQQVLESRGVVIPDGSQSRSTLVQLFYQYALPLPQRQYRNNRQGQLLSRSQQLTNKRRRPAQQDVENSLLDDAKRRKTETGKKSGLVNSPVVPAENGGGLKSAINYRRGTIKLNSSSQKPNQESVEMAEVSSAKHPDREKNKPVSSTQPEQSQLASPAKKARTKITWP